uniref:Uncharacterized protein n=1 Tax=Physcomitrium patens TaxID=3218 RepID=A0A2K1L4I6_PHYPA|nr:hypothetical protein PHYPA_003741 [Physcomitrium patens]
MSRVPGELQSPKSRRNRISWWSPGEVEVDRSSYRFYFFFVCLDQCQILHPGPLLLQYCLDAAEEQARSHSV